MNTMSASLRTPLSCSLLSKWFAHLDGEFTEFGERINRKLILTHRKDLLKGDILIDDRPNNGAKNFDGELITFGSDQYPKWDAVLDYLL